MEVAATDVESVVAGQRRRRRVRFWLGFAVIALIGGLWAGLSKDPIGPGLFNEGVIFEDAPAIEIGEFEDFEVPTTTIGPELPPPDDTNTTAG